MNTLSEHALVITFFRFGGVRHNARSTSVNCRKGSGDLEGEHKNIAKLVVKDNLPVE